MKNNIQQTPQMCGMRAMSRSAAVISDSGFSTGSSIRRNGRLVTVAVAVPGVATLSGIAARAVVDMDTASGNGICSTAYLHVLTAARTASAVAPGATLAAISRQPQPPVRACRIASRYGATRAVVFSGPSISHLLFMAFIIYCHHSNIFA